MFYRNENHCKQNVWRDNETGDKEDDEMVCLATSEENADLIRIALNRMTYE